MKTFAALAILLGVAVPASAEDFSWKTFKHNGFDFYTPESKLANYEAGMTDSGSIFYIYPGGQIAYGQNGEVSMIVVDVPSNIARSTHDLKVKLHRKFKGQDVKIVNGSWVWPDGTMVIVIENNREVKMGVLRTEAMESKAEPNPGGNNFPLEF